MDKLDIEIFTAVVNESNIQRAASVLYLSPSTIGTRLKMLEKELGVELIFRQKGKREIILTPKGEEFLPIANNLIASFNDCEKLNNKSFNPYVTIATIDSMIGDGLAPLYKNIIFDNPNFKLDLQCYPADMIYSIVERRKADIGFALYEIKSKDLDVKPIVTDEMVVVLSKYSNITKSKIHTNELDSELELKIGKNNELYRGWGPEFKMWHGKYFDQNTTALLTTTSVSFLKYFLDGGNCWALLPKAIAVSHQKQYGYRIVELENPAPPRVVYMATHKQQTSTAQRNIALFNIQLYAYLEKLKSQNIITVL
ncbi:LysR family transcriptional regulator [Abyssisolibacter fermentans]|uniref:LysR family transcriptional regulator n=1 Tax=Abyssisolibacter fermentans TaxID=1766203 RepID=UPI00082CD645|nr:LysR family transcriptional regulator [Abyssisolibacter fermentans]